MRLRRGGAGSTKDVETTGESCRNEEAGSEGQRQGVGEVGGGGPRLEAAGVRGRAERQQQLHALRLPGGRRPVERGEPGLLGYERVVLLLCCVVVLLMWMCAREFRR